MRVYAYGGRRPFENDALIEQQLRLAHDYQVALVKIERRRREVVERCYRQACPTEWQGYEAASAATEAAADKMRLTRTRPGDMLEPDEEMKAEAREVARALKEHLGKLREAEKAALDAWRKARKAATPRLRARLKMCDRGAKARKKYAYNAAGSVGLAWGTRLKIDESVERSAEMSAKEGSMPRVPLYDGTGSLVVQLQGESGIEDKRGLAPADAMAGTDTRFRLEMVDAATWQMVQSRSAYVGKNGRALDQPDPKSARSQRRQAGSYAIVRLRIASDGRQPIWAAWPVVVHRPLPPKAPIKWASMHRRKVGDRMEWQLEVTVADEQPAVRKAGPTLALNLGWRHLDDGGLRVAYAVGSDGHKEEVRVPVAFVEGVAHVDSLRGIRDRMFEKAKLALAAFVEDNKIPDWLTEEARYLSYWRTPRKLARLLGRWTTQRFKGDERTWKVLGAWAKQNRHLRFWECDEREKLLRMRKDFYRCLASRWAKGYRRILVTDMDLRDFAKLSPPEEAAKTEGNEQRRGRMLAAPSILRAAVENASTTSASECEEKSGLFKTQTCNACGVVFAFAAKQDLLHTCECGARWDQDANHCLNLLTSDKVVRKKASPLAPSEKDKKEAAAQEGGRWGKRRSQTGVQLPVKKKQNG